MIHFALGFDSLKRGESAASELKSRGYEVKITIMIDAVKTIGIDSEPELARADVEKLAQQFDGQFLGNGGFRQEIPPKIGEAARRPVLHRSSGRLAAVCKRTGLVGSR